MKYNIREMKDYEYHLLELFLYEAVFQREGEELLSPDIIKEDSLQVYTKEFGFREDDYCLCAEINNEIVGAVWIRNIDGFGSIDHKTPEFAISIYKQYRNYGIGTELMKKMLHYLSEQGYQQASLAVQKDNYALEMYKKLGFNIISENHEEYIMIWHNS